MRWPPFQHIFFDCDSTLTAVEGIDILAEATGTKAEVEALTNAAMDGQIDLEDVYAERLKVVQPTRGQVREIRRSYKRNVVEDARDVIAALQYCGRDVYIISGGLYEPVKEFGIWLGVPEVNIRAVNLHYDALTGRWWESQGAAASDRYKSFNHGALTVSDGKAKIVAELLAASNGRGYNQRSLLVGDGNSDLLASHSVDLFVGYGGVAARQRVLAEAPAVIQGRSLAPLLALALGPAGLAELENTPHAAVAKKGLQQVELGELTFNHERISQKFQEAYQAVFARSN